MKNDRAHKYPREPEEFKKTFRRIGRITWKPPEGYSPAGFSESDAGVFIRRVFGEPPDRECDDGLIWQPSECHEDDQRNIQKVTDCRLETTRSSDNEVHDDSCLAMDSCKFHIYSEFYEGYLN